MKLGYVIVYVPALAPALEFYEQAFGLTRRFVDESGKYGELATGETVLAFAAEEMLVANGLTARPNRASEDAAAVEIAFVTDDVEAAFERAMKAGATKVKGATQKPWGQVVAYVRDLNGVLVELCTPMGA